MALRISKKLEIYEISGVLSYDNCVSLKSYFEFQIENSAFLKISLKQIERIDEKLVKTLTFLYKKASSKNKVLVILGIKDKLAVALFKKENITTY
jgi:anti-anti-sigma regulatory factor